LKFFAAAHFEFTARTARIESVFLNNLEKPAAQNPDHPTRVKNYCGWLKKVFQKMNSTLSDNFFSPAGTER